MSGGDGTLAARCARTLRAHVAAGDEATLAAAYALGRDALDHGLGVLDMALLLARAARGPLRAARGHGAEARLESFLLECLSPFEMAHRGAREANAALRRLDELREEQARRIARELHDQSGQLLASVYLALGELESQVPAAGRAAYLEVRARLQAVEEEIRRLAHELRPAVLDDLGFLPALRALAEGVRLRSGLRVRVTARAPGRFPPAVETALYRAAQEALRNVVRHAGASQAQVEVRRLPRELECRIRDDGHGFDPRPALAGRGRGGAGLRGIRERLAPLGGTLAIASQPGRGAELLLRIPLEVSHVHATADR